MPRTWPSQSGADHGIVAAGPEQRAGAHHHDQRDGNAQPPAAQMARRSTECAQNARKARFRYSVFVLVAGIGNIARLARLGRGRGRDQLEVEDQHLVGRDHAVARAARAISQVGRDHQLPVIAFAHQLQRLDPAGDHVG